MSAGTSTGDAPTTPELARRLGVDGELLARFADAHPDPSPTYILGWADADPDHRDAVAAWLAAREREKRRRREGDTPGGGRS